MKRTDPHFVIPAVRHPGNVFEPGPAGIQAESTVFPYYMELNSLDPGLKPAGVRCVGTLKSCRGDVLGVRS